MSVAGSAQLTLRRLNLYALLFALVVWWVVWKRLDDGAAVLAPLDVAAPRQTSR